MEQETYVLQHKFCYAHFTFSWEEEIRGTGKETRQLPPAQWSRAARPLPGSGWPTRRLTSPLAHSGWVGAAALQAALPSCPRREAPKMGLMCTSALEWRGEKRVSFFLYCGQVLSLTHRERYFFYTFCGVSTTALTKIRYFFPLSNGLLANPS